MKTPLIVYWSRRDLRLKDNPALSKAIVESAHAGIPLLPMFILESYMCAGDARSQFGYPSRVFLSRALPQFAKHFEQFSLCKAEAISLFKKLNEQFVLTVYVNEDVHPDFYKQTRKLKEEGIAIHLCKDQLTIDRYTETGIKSLYSVFTPFKKRVWEGFVTSDVVSMAVPAMAKKMSEDEIALLPKRVQLTEKSIMSEFSDMRTLIVGTHSINLDHHTEVPDLNGWYVTEEECLKRFDAFLKSGGLHKYNHSRDSLEDDREMTDGGGSSTSRMSLGLTWGLVSARTLVECIQKHTKLVLKNHDVAAHHDGAYTFISELLWREFYKYLYFHNPSLQFKEFQTKYQSITWAEDSVALSRFMAWIRGETGYPIVDAAMHQLEKTGWMHNRARMIVSSVLTKNLGVDWRWGQEYFRATLIDLDEASNNGGWQWGASVGADPKPIRIFNPELQAEKHDASGAYQRKWLGEERFNNPIEAIVPHADARKEALKRYNLNAR